MSDKQLPAGSEVTVPPPAPGVEKWRALWWLPCDLSPQVPLTQFTVGELLRLHPGSIVASGWNRSTEIPLYANGQLIGWAELDSVGEHIGARITELV